MPILIELRWLSDPTAGLLLALAEALSRPELALSDPVGFANKLFDRDRLLVLVDGLDEVADARQRAWAEPARSRASNASLAKISAISASPTNCCSRRRLKAAVSMRFEIGRRSASAASRNSS